MIDATNKQMVAVRGDKIVILAYGRTLTPDDAMNLAAWLVAMAEAVRTVHADDFDPSEEFDMWLQAVRAT